MIFCLLPLLVLVLIVLLSTTLVVLRYGSLRVPMSKQYMFEIVIARYNEDLSWMRHPLVESLLKANENRTIITVYNKGPNRLHMQNLRGFKFREYALENIGRDMHTYVNHICKRYNSLADITIFLPGSCDMFHKFVLLLNIIYKAYGRNDSVFQCADASGFISSIRDYEVTSYGSTSTQNRSMNPNKKLTPAKVRPYGRWYDVVLGMDVPLRYTTQFGLMAVARKHIHNRPRSFYDHLVKELSVPDPELGFYIEMSWVSIFHPVPPECVDTTAMLTLWNTIVKPMRMKSF